MRITNIRDITVPLEGNISNAIVSFNDHTVSLVAVVSDQTRNGKAVVGFGFNSIGRYAQSGILRDRIIPRILNCPPELLLATNGTEFDAAAVASIAMKNEKPGGHGDRAGAVGALAYTFSDSFWFSAVEGEVYAMSSFFTAAAFWAVLKWEQAVDEDPHANKWRGFN